MGAEVAEKAPANSNKGLRRLKRRLPVRIDMTPMVDIAFLLLIFYMVTTVFAMPQAMEINLPPSDKVLEVKHLLTIRVDACGALWWNEGVVTPDNLPSLLPNNGDTLRGLLVAENRANDRLNTLVLIHPDADYENMVDILDEIDVIERSWNAYTAERLGLSIDDLPKEERFSYRYAFGEWEPKDDHKIEAAREALGL